MAIAMPPYPRSSQKLASCGPAIRGEWPDERWHALGFIGQERGPASQPAMYRTGLGFHIAAWERKRVVGERGGPSSTSLSSNLPSDTFLILELFFLWGEVEGSALGPYVKIKLGQSVFAERDEGGREGEYNKGGMYTRVLFTSASSPVPSDRI